MMALTISSELHSRLLAEAAASPVLEICGLLIGDVVVERIIPTLNVALDPRRAFEIDPATLFSAIRAERSGHGRVLGYYHSHPVGPPTPSECDRDQATVDGRKWLIIGEGQVRAWQMSKANEFIAVNLLVTK